MKIDKSKLYYDPDITWHRWFRKILIFVAAFTVFILAWWDISLFVNSPVITPPDKALTALITLFIEGDSVSGYSMWHHIGTSLGRFLTGLLLTAVIAIPLGLIVGMNQSIKEFLSPIIEMLRPIAPIAWAPILIFALGYSWGPIAVVFIGIFFPLLTNTIFGVHKIDRNLVDAARTFGASRGQIFRSVIFPCSVPYVMNGIRIGSGIGWMCIVASELYASTGGGIGYFVGLQANIGYWPNVYAGIIVIAILGLLTTTVFEYVYRFVSNLMGLDDE